MGNLPIGMALYAALSEHIYRRNDTSDQAVKLSDIRDDLTPVQNLDVQSLGLTLMQDRSGHT